jgi:hypothetical protein
VAANEWAILSGGGLNIIAGGGGGTDWTNFHDVTQSAWYLAGQVSVSQSFTNWAFSTLGTFGVDVNCVAVPFKSNRGGTLSNLGCHISTVVSGASVLLNVYANSSTSDLRPTTKLGTDVSIDASLTGDHSGAFTLALTPGVIYWLVAQPTGSSANTVQITASPNVSITDPILGWSYFSFANAFKWTHFIDGSPLPATFTPTPLIATQPMPCLFYQFGS